MPDITQVNADNTVVDKSVGNTVAGTDLLSVNRLEVVAGNNSADMLNLVVVNDTQLTFTMEDIIASNLMLGAATIEAFVPAALGLSTDAGAYTTTGSAMDLHVKRILDLDSDTYSTTGYDATLDVPVTTPNPPTDLILSTP